MDFTAQLDVDVVALEADSQSSEQADCLPSVL